MSETTSPAVDAVRPAAPAAAAGAFYKAAWRWHFYAGLFVMPFFCVLALTGLMMMYIAAFDGREGDLIRLPSPAAAGQAALPLTEQAEKAVAAAGGGAVVEWLKPRTPDHVGVFRVKGEAGQTMVALDPYTGTVVETWSRRQGWYDLADNIHSDLLLGPVGDRLLEIAAGLGIVLIVTGLYMWWPREGGLGRILLPSFRQSGRAWWKTLHGTVGLYGSVFLLLFLLSGMSWTGVWGAKLVQAWSTFPAEKWDAVPLSDETHASMNHGPVSEVPWALEQTPMPASGSAAGRAGIAAGAPVTLDAVAALAGDLGFTGRYRVAYPAGPSGVWTINQDTMSNDAENPMGDRTVHIDRYSGRILADVGFADYSLAGKTMAVSIPLHMGLTGWWNLALNTAVCLAVIALAVSGAVLWWARRPAMASLRLLPPQVPGGMPHWRGAMVVMLALSLAFPLVGLTLVAVLAFDLLVLSRLPAMARALR